MKKASFILARKSVVLSSLGAVVLAVVVGVTAMRADDPIKPDVGPKRGKDVLVIQESRDAQTFNAESQDVTVQGNGNKVTIKGSCHALTIGGDHNQVSVSTVTGITVSGSHNQIAWSKANGGEKPQITNLGKDNEVSKVALRE